ncbi:MAG TPA: hypothetical protein VEM33_02370 [Burkholderiales bacterium]|nr:hypothetical protein [Burkholderiales bacterium]
MRASQRGLSAFGMVVVLAIAVAAGYYAYKSLSGSGDAPTCRSASTACIQKCRRTTTEAPAAQACQEGCQRDLTACERPGR